MSVFQLPNRKWKVVWRGEDPFNPRKQSTKTFDDEIDACDWDNLKKRQKRDGVLVQPNMRPLKKTVDDLVEMYLQDCEVNRVSEKYVRFKRGTYYSVVKERLPDKPAVDLTYLDFHKVMHYYSKLTAGTTNQVMSFLKRVFKFAVKHDYLTVNPLEQWKQLKEDKLEYRLTIEDFMKIHKAAIGHIKWIIEVALMFGLRPGETELLTLRWDSINFETLEVSVWQTKTRSWKTIPFSEEFKARLIDKKAAAKTQYVIEKDGRPVRNFWKGFHRAVVRSGLKYRVRPYDIRHLFATTMLANGAEIGAVSHVLGHATIKTTIDKYYHPLSAAKREAVSKLPKIESPLG